MSRADRRAFSYRGTHEVIHPHLGKNDAFVRMFLNEARIAASVSHRNVCSVFDCGEQDGSHYMAMDYLAGATLRHLLRRLREKRNGEIEPTDIVCLAYIIAQACEGLHAAHELRGPDDELLEIVHRDVSPQNLFVTYDGNVSVIDFGIARAADRLQETDAGVLKGKFSYMAPEQIRQSHVDRRGDLWSLGVCLWEALAQRRLFMRATQAETLMAVIADPIEPASSLSQAVPARLDAIVARALCRDPDERYSTARDMGRDLMAFCTESGMPIGSVELECFMQELCPNELAESSAMVRRAKRAARDERDCQRGNVARGDAGLVLQPDLAEASAAQADFLPGGAALLAEARPSLAGEGRRVPLRSFWGGALFASVVVSGGLLGALHANGPVHLLRAGRSARFDSGAQRTQRPPPEQPAGASAVNLGIRAREPAQAALSLPKKAAPRADPVPASEVPLDPAMARTLRRPTLASLQPKPVAPAAQTDPGAQTKPSDDVVLRPAAAAAEEASAPFAAAVVPNPPSEPVRDPRPLDATLSFAQIHTLGSLGPGVVWRMLHRSAPLLRSCYQRAARAAMRNDYAPVSVSFIIDETGQARKAATRSLRGL